MAVNDKVNESALSDASPFSWVVGDSSSVDSSVVDEYGDDTAFADGDTLIGAVNSASLSLCSADNKGVEDTVVLVDDRAVCFINNGSTLSPAFVASVCTVLSPSVVDGTACISIPPLVDGNCVISTPCVEVFVGAPFDAELCSSVGSKSFDPVPVNAVTDVIVVIDVVADSLSSVARNVDEVKANVESSESSFAVVTNFSMNVVCLSVVSSVVRPDETTDVNAGSTFTAPAACDPNIVTDVDSILVEFGVKRTAAVIPSVSDVSIPALVVGTKFLPDSFAIFDADTVGDVDLNIAASVVNAVLAAICVSWFWVDASCVLMEDGKTLSVVFVVFIVLVES